MSPRNIRSYIILLTCCITLSCSKDDDTHPPIVTPPTRISGRTYSADEVTAFKQMTLHAVPEIIKWPKKVSFYIVDTGYAFMNKEVDSVLQEINLLLDTNLVATRTGSRITADILIYLTDRDTYIAAEPAATLQKADYSGLTILQWNVQGFIEQGSVFVDMKRTEGDTMTQGVIVHHEIMHALGFYGHVSLPYITNTILYSERQWPIITDYTSLDKRMMLLLYNPSILPGMSEIEFNEVIKNL